jgi:hypothetical protein
VGEEVFILAHVVEDHLLAQVALHAQAQFLACFMCPDELLAQIVGKYLRQSRAWLATLCTLGHTEQYCEISDNLA